MAASAMSYTCALPDHTADKDNSRWELGATGHGPAGQASTVIRTGHRVSNPSGWQHYRVSSMRNYY
jgi:hypothetical protein